MIDQPQISRAAEIRPETVQPIIRELLIVISMLTIMGLAMLMPGTGQEIPGTPVSVGDLIIALGSLGIVGSLIWIGPKLREMIVSNLEGSSEVIHDAASIVRNLAVFAAVLVAHWGFSPVLVPLLEVTWIYDVGFLVLAIIPIAVIAYRLYNSLDPLSEFLTNELIGEPEGQYPESNDPNNEDGWSKPQ
jgi:hypothetical protein